MSLSSNRLLKKGICLSKVFANSLKPHRPILVYQMGKVGSSAIYHTLLRNLRSYPVYHLHFLSDNGISWLETRFRNNKSILPGLHYYNAKYVRKHLARWKEEGRVFVVTMVREPIIRNVSAFFQSINAYIPDFAVPNEISNDYIKHLIDIFLDKFDHNFPLDWFDQEINTVFEIDVYSNPFPFSKGYEIIERGNVTLLIIRCEGISKFSNHAFRDFLGIDNFHVITKNRSEDKKYSDLYKTFRQFIALPDSYINRMYDSKYSKHFYSADELADFGKHWIK